MIQVENIFAKCDIIVIKIGDIRDTKQGRPGWMLTSAKIWADSAILFRRESDLVGADEESDLLDVRKTNSEWWLIGCVNLKRGSNCVCFADENEMFL